MACAKRKKGLAPFGTSPLLTWIGPRPVQSACGTCGTLASVVRHKRLGTATSTGGLGESRLAGSEITTRCACIGTGGKTALTGITEARLAAIAVAITAGSGKATIATTVVTASKAAATVTTLVTVTRCGSTTVFATAASKPAAKATTETATVIAAACGPAETATRSVISVVIRTAWGTTATATAKVATARCLG